MLADSESGEWCWAATEEHPEATPASAEQTEEPFHADRRYGADEVADGTLFREVGHLDEDAQLFARGIEE